MILGVTDDCEGFFRVYKSAHVHKEVIHKINNDTGIHFDPTTVDACLTISNEIEKMMQTWTNLEI